MTRNVCIQGIREATGNPNLSAKEAADLFKLLERNAKRLKAENASLSATDAIQAAADQFKVNADIKAKVEARNAYLSLMRRAEAVDNIMTTWKDDPAAGLKALLVGTQDARRGARLSADTEHMQLKGQYVGGLMADVGKVDGGLAILASGDMDADIGRVLWALNTPGADLSKFDPRAVGLGKVIHKWQETSRVNANDAGAWIGKQDGYIVSQAHDGAKISANKAGWIEAMRARADLPRMMSETGALSEDALLDSLWNALSSGVHLSREGGQKGGGKGLSGAAAKVSQERVIHFKSADDWAAYNGQFGVGTLRDAVVFGLERSARATALMRVLGPNHLDNYQRIVAEVQRRLRADNVGPKIESKFDEDARFFDRNYLAELDGSLDIPGSDTMATWFGGIRAVQNMASLGGSLLSSVSDLAVMSLGAKYNGANFLEAPLKGLGNLFTGVPNAERLELFADLGLALESMASKFTSSRFSIDDGVPGLLGNMQKAFFTLNLQNRWTDAMRTAIAEGLSSNLARRVGQSFTELGDDLRTNLGLYGIDEGKWNIIRQYGVGEVQGQKFVSPRNLSAAPDDVFKDYLNGLGFNGSAAEIRNLRSEIERQLRGYFVDQNGYMLLTPSGATRGLMKMGTRRGTWAGEFIRTIMQFKSFTFEFTQRVAGRELRQHGMMGVARMIAATTLMGYVAMSLKDLAKGREPRDATDWKTWVASMQQGGGLGVYGDLLFSQVLERSGSDAALQLFGPTASDLLGSQGVAGIASSTIQRASEGRPTDFGAKSARFIQNNTPFLNLFYTKLALDYAILWNVQESLNPGSLARMERDLRDRTGQELLVSPTRDRLRFED